MSENDAEPALDWDAMRLHAQTRAPMYIGPQETAHRQAIHDVLRLVWQAKVFLRSQRVTIDLSPTQYVVRAETGPLIRPIQKIFSFGTSDTLSKNWPAQMKAYHDWTQTTSLRRYDWRYCFSGPTGPRLGAPSYPFVLARCLVWGLRTNEGLWCESFKSGQPISKPFLLKQPSPVGLMAATELDAHWFTGLPFTPEDAVRYSAMSHRPSVSPHRFRPHPNWTPGEIVARWHEKDNLITDATLTPNGAAALLQTDT